MDSAVAPASAAREQSATRKTAAAETASRMTRGRGAESAHRSSQAQCTCSDRLRSLLPCRTCGVDEEDVVAQVRLGGLARRRRHRPRVARALMRRRRRRRAARRTRRRLFQRAQRGGAQRAQAHAAPAEAEGGDSNAEGASSSPADGRQSVRLRPEPRAYCAAITPAVRQAAVTWHLRCPAPRACRPARAARCPAAPCRPRSRGAWPPAGRRA